MQLQLQEKCMKFDYVFTKASQYSMFKQKNALI